MSRASLDIRKYSWYPNKKIDTALSTYTVSPTPKRFDRIPDSESLQGPNQDEDMAPNASAMKVGVAPRTSVRLFECGIHNPNQSAGLKPGHSSSSSATGLSNTLRRHTVVHSQHSQLLLLKTIQESHLVEEQMDL
jgi:hypothetical protein